MIGRLKRTRAASLFDTYAERAFQLNMRCSATWGLIETAGREKTEFPAFFELLGELATMHMDFARFAAFVRHYDPESDDASRLSEHIEAANKLPPWWSNLESKIEAEILNVEAGLEGAVASEASS